MVYLTMGDGKNIADAVGKSVFLLGAGFSRDADLPTSVQMFDEIKSKILNDGDTSFTPAQKETLKFLISCLKYHSEWRTMEASDKFTFSPNIEELALLIRRVKNRENFLPYPITGNWADKLVQLESDYSNEPGAGKNLFESLESEIRRLLKEEWLIVQEKSKLKYLSPLSDFLKANPNEEFRFDFFSLNYDTIIEEYFGDEGEIPWRGYSNGRWVNVDPDLVNESQSRINLYKLHGSIDWVRLEDMDAWETNKLQDSQLENIEDKHDPYIIFGQGTKSFSVEPFFSLIHHFNSVLNNEDKRYFFVIGYSFFDPYINNLIFNAVKDSRKLVIVNPSLNLNEVFEEETVGGWTRPKSDKDKYFQVVYKDGRNKGNLTDFLRDIQKNSFYSELPEYNYLSSLSAENVEYLPLTTKDFIELFFKDKGSLFLKYIDHFEDQREDETPF